MKELRGKIRESLISALPVTVIVYLLSFTPLLDVSVGELITFTIGAVLLVVGIVHTGIAYALYFGSMDGLKAQTIALFSYIDPVVAILLSAALLHEDIGLWGALGAVLILGSTLVSELWGEKK